MAKTKIGFTLAKGGRSPLLCGDGSHRLLLNGDEGTHTSPYLVTKGSPRLIKRGFTLAEVLITLGVIGVVAAVTMPTLIQNYKKHVVETRLQSQVAMWQNAIRMAESKHGFINEWSNCAVTEEGNANFKRECNENFFKTYLAPELKVVKICGYDDFYECWTPPKALTSDDTSFLSLTNARNNGYLTALLENGSSLYFWTGGMDQNSRYAPHLQIRFDIDGPNRGPARIGGDVFSGTIMLNNPKGGIDFLTNTNYPPEGCSATTTGIQAGANCGALIRANGWKIPKDYPFKF